MKPVSQRVSASNRPVFGRWQAGFAVVWHQGSWLAADIAAQLEPRQPTAGVATAASVTSQSLQGHSCRHSRCTRTARAGQTPDDASVGADEV